VAEYHDWGFACKGCGIAIVYDANRLTRDGAPRESGGGRSKPFEDLKCNKCGKSFNYFDDPMVDLGLSDA
jgi:hypothetical protein